MNILKKLPILPFAALASGAAALALRASLYAFALDRKGLLISSHPLTYALWAVVLLGTAFILWKVQRANVCPENFAPSRSATVGSGLMALGILMTVTGPAPSGTTTLILLWKIQGFLSIPALVWAGVSRYQGKKPFFGTHALLCVFLLIHMVSSYQTWSGNPQLQDYIFELLGAIALTLFSYHCAAFEADMGSRRMYLATGLLAVLLCPTALAGSGSGWIYAYGTVWAFSELCALTPPPKEEVSADDPS